MANKSIVLVIILLATALLITTPALATGVGVTPGRLTVHVDEGVSVNDTLYVFNQSDEDAEFNVYVDEPFTEWVTFSPGNFILDPGARKEVAITIAPSRDSSGEHECTIYIVASAPQSGLHLGAGIKVPANITVFPGSTGNVASIDEETLDKIMPYVVIAIYVAVIIALVLFILRLRRKQHV